MDMTMRNDEIHPATPVTRHPSARAARRPLRRALLVTAGIALSALLPCSLRAQTAPTCSGPAFTPIGEIKSKDGTLQAVMKVVNGNRDVPNASGSTTTMMLRYYDGYNPA